MARGVAPKLMSYRVTSEPPGPGVWTDDTSCDGMNGKGLCAELKWAGFPWHILSHVPDGPKIMQQDVDCMSLRPRICNMVSIRLRVYLKQKATRPSGRHRAGFRHQTSPFHLCRRPSVLTNFQLRPFILSSRRPDRDRLLQSGT